MGKVTATLLAGLLALGVARADETPAPVRYLHIQPLAAPSRDAYVAALRAEARQGRMAPGNLIFDIGTDQTTLVVVEGWSDPAAHLAHQSTAQVAAVKALLPGALAGPERLYPLQAVNGLPAPAPMATDATGASKNIVVRLRTKPAQRQRFLDALGEVIEQSRLSSGCLLFNVYQQGDDANQFVIHERWVDAAAHQQHLATPYTRAFIGRLNAMLEEAPEGWEIRDQIEE